MHTVACDNRFGGNFTGLTDVMVCLFRAYWMYNIPAKWDNSTIYWQNNLPAIRNKESFGNPQWTEGLLR